MTTPIFKRYRPWVAYFKIIDKESARDEIQRYNRAGGRSNIRYQVSVAGSLVMFLSFTRVPTCKLRRSSPLPARFVAEELNASHAYS